MTKNESSESKEEKTKPVVKDMDWLKQHPSKYDRGCIKAYRKGKVSKKWIISQVGYVPIKEDVNKLFETCMQEGTEHSFGVSDICTYLSSPFYMYCDLHADSTKQDPDPEQCLKTILGEKGDEVDIEEESSPKMIHKKTSIQSEDKFKETLYSMFEGEPIFHKVKLFYLPDGMCEKIPQIVRNEGKSIFGSHHYIIKETGSSRKIKESHILQVALYNHIIGKIQGYMPPLFYIIDSEGKETAYVFANYREGLEQIIDNVAKIHKGVMPSPTFGKCSYPWNNYCDNMALEMRDISLVRGVGVDKKRLFTYNGITKIDTIWSLSESELQDRIGITRKECRNYIKSAKALVTKEAVRRSRRPELKEKSIEIFLDLRRMNANIRWRISTEQTEYLIGLWIRKDGKEEYKSFVAKSSDKVEEMLNEFVDFMKKQTDYIIYYWQRQKKKDLVNMMKRYEIPQGTQDLVLSELIFWNLNEVVQEQFFLPIPNMGLREVAKWTGFNWKYTEDEVMNSVVLFPKYLKNPDETSLGLILDHSEEECKAIKSIKDWLWSQWDVY